jgi:protein transport protein SEC24
VTVEDPPSRFFETTTRPFSISSSSAVSRRLSVVLLSRAERAVVQRMAHQLPPGWASEWNEQYQRPLFVHVATGKTQWDPPDDLPPPDLPQGAGNRASMPPLASPPPGNAAAPPAPSAPRSKRQYAPNQVAAYDLAPDPASSGQFFSPGAPEPPQSQYFSPAGEQGPQPPPYGQPPTAYPSQAHGHTRTASVGGYGAYGGGQQPGIQGVTQQFGQMGLGQSGHTRLVRVSL